MKDQICGISQQQPEQQQSNRPNIRYNIIKERLEALGYVVMGDVFNAADFGVPQQRRRAWVFCIQASEIQGQLSCLADANQFRRLNVSIEKCLDGKVAPTKGNGKVESKGSKPKNLKWLEGFKKQCKIYGKDRVVTQTVVTKKI